jgi:hypothetical protein
VPIFLGRTRPELWVFLPEVRNDFVEIETAAERCSRCAPAVLKIVVQLLFSYRADVHARFIFNREKQMTKTTSCDSAGEVPLAMVIVLAVVAVMAYFGLTGCSEAALGIPTTASSVAPEQKLHIAEILQANGPVAARDLLPIRSVVVQQYEDRVPQRQGEPPLPTVMTLVQFEIDVCENDVSDVDFAALPESTGGFARVQVIAKRRFQPCTKPSPQTFIARTPAFTKGAAIAVANPLLVEMIAAAN